MKRTGIIITIIALLISLIVINFVAARHPVRLDLTANRMYTLSGATKAIIKRLDDVVTIRVYFTEDLPPTLQMVRRNVDDILAEFKNTAGGNIQVEFIDPNTSPLDEQKAMMLGIPPIQLNVIEHDKQQVAKIYLGMAVMFGDRQQVIPVIKRVENLEYDLAESIIKVSSKELPRIAWWRHRKAGDADMESYHAIRDALSRRYTVTDIGEKQLEELDLKNFAALVLTSPGEMNDNELFWLDQYVMSGGRLIALVNLFEVDSQMNAIPVKTNAPDLLGHYGVTVENSLVLDQSNATAAFSGGPVTYHLPYAYWPDIRSNQFNQSQPIVSDLESVVLPWTSPLSLSKADGISRDEEILARSTPYAATRKSDSIQLDPQSANEALLSENRKAETLIALLDGPFGTYFTSDRIKVPRGQDVIRESPQTSRIFVVGSSYWIGDRFLHNFPANAALFENAVDAFAMGDELIGIRSREKTSQPIAILSDGIKSFIRYINLAAGPIIILAIGLAIYLLRRRRCRAVRLSYGK